MNYNKLTPVEEYDGIFYKRDDLFSPFDNGVNGGKARQAIALIEKNLKYIQEECNNTIITATNVQSPQGLIISTVGKHFGCKVIVGFGYYWGKDKLIAKNPLIKKAQEAGGNIEVIANASYPSVVNCAIDKLSKEENYYQIKFGINAADNADSIFGVISNQVQNLPNDLDLLVIPVGSGLNFAGVLIGLVKYNIKPKRIVGILSGMDSISVIEKILIPDNIIRATDEELPLDDFDNAIIPPILEYELYFSDIKYAKKVIIDKPFNIDPIYEAKSLVWLEEEKARCTLGKTLVWIVGNQRTM